MTALIGFVIAGVTLLLIAGLMLYLYPGVKIIPAGKESQPQQTLIQEDIRAGTNSYQQVNITVNDQILIADISATHEQRTKGLSVKDALAEDRKSTRLNSSHANISYAVFCLKKR